MINYKIIKYCIVAVSFFLLRFSFANNFENYARVFNDCTIQNQENGLTLICTDNYNISYRLKFTGSYQPYNTYIDHGFKLSCRVEYHNEAIEKIEAYRRMDLAVISKQYSLVSENENLEFSISGNNIIALCELMTAKNQSIPFKTFIHNRSFETENIQFNLSLFDSVNIELALFRYAINQIKNDVYTDEVFNTLILASKKCAEEGNKPNNERTYLSINECQFIVGVLKTILTMNDDSLKDMNDKILHILIELSELNKEQHQYITQMIHKLQDPEKFVDETFEILREERFFDFRKKILTFVDAFYYQYIKQFLKNENDNIVEPTERQKAISSELQMMSSKILGKLSQDFRGSTKEQREKINHHWNFNQPKKLTLITQDTGADIETDLYYLLPNIRADFINFYDGLNRLNALKLQNQHKKNIMMGFKQNFSDIYYDNDISFKNWIEKNQIELMGIVWSSLEKDLKIEVFKLMFDDYNILKRENDVIPLFHLVDEITVQHEGMFFGKSYQVQDKLSVIDYLDDRFLHFGNPKEARLIELKFRFGKAQQISSGDVEKAVYQLQILMGIPPRSQHIHNVARLPIGFDQKITRIALAEFYSRVDVLTQMYSVQGSLTPIVDRKSAQHIYFQSQKSHELAKVFSGIKNSPNDKLNLQVNAYQTLERSFSYSNLQPSSRYQSQYPLWGIETRLGGTKDASVFQSAVQYSMEYGEYGLNREVFAHWLLENEFDLNNINTEKLSEKLYYNQPLKNLYNNSPQFIKDRLNEKFNISNAADFEYSYSEILNDYSQGLKMLFFDWSKHPLFFNNPELVNHVEEAQKYYFDLYLNLQWPQQQLTALKLVHYFLYDSLVLQNYSNSIIFVKE